MAEDGSLKSSLFILMDGGHGPAENLMQFCLGLLWVLLDLNVVHGVSNAGGCSKFQAHPHIPCLSVCVDCVLIVC
jgi:hypothetical protein